MTAPSTITTSPTAKGGLRVLVSDDHPDILEALRLLLKGAGYMAETVDSPQALLRAIDAHPFDLILMDLNYTRDTTSGQEGLDLLDKLRARPDCAPVIVMTAWGNVELAVDAMQRGATDFVQKPWDNLRLLGTIEKQAREAAQGARSGSRRARKSRSRGTCRRSCSPSRPDGSGPFGMRRAACPRAMSSGDYYDFLDFGGDAMGFVLGDVSGKGIAAALLMASLQTAFRTQAEVIRDGCELCAASTGCSIRARRPNNTPPCFSPIMTTGSARCATSTAVIQPRCLCAPPGRWSGCTPRRRWSDC